MVIGKLYNGWQVRLKRFNNLDNSLEWYKLDVKHVESYRKNLGKYVDSTECNKLINNSIKLGCFCFRIDLDKWHQWLIKNMIRYGWIKGSFKNGLKLTKKGKKLYETSSCKPFAQDPPF